MCVCDLCRTCSRHAFEHLCMTCVYDVCACVLEGGGGAVWVYSREAEEECGGGDQKGGCRGDGYIAAGVEPTGRRRGGATHFSP